MTTTPFLRRVSTDFVEATLQEFTQEAAITRRVLERVPPEQLEWAPHRRARSIGALAIHVAVGPGAMIEWVANGTADLPDIDGEEPLPPALDAILDAHDASVSAVTRTLKRLPSTAMQDMCVLRKHGATFMAMPKLAVLRTLVMNHWIHHRGQLSVYLRLLDIPVPSIYGPSADEKPFTHL